MTSKWPGLIIYLNAKLKKCVFNNLVLNVYLSFPLYVNQRAVHSTALVPLSVLSGHRELYALLRERRVLDLCEIIRNIVHHRQLTYQIYT